MSMRRAALAALALALPLGGLGGCVMKSDVEAMQAQIRDLQVRQDSMYQRLARLGLAVRDSVRVNSRILHEMRGDVAIQLVDIQDQLITLQELTGQSQRNLAALRDQLESQRRAVPTAETVAGEEGGADAVEMYNAGVTQFNRGSFQTARRAFEQFLQAYPSHRLAPDAQFYLADILVQENRLEDAVAAFLRIGELWPSSNKVPDSLYRLGLIELELGNEGRARTYLQRVVNTYPDHPSAMLAREKLREIG